MIHAEDRQTVSQTVVSLSLRPYRFSVGDFGARGGHVEVQTDIRARLELQGNIWSQYELLQEDFRGETGEFSHDATAVPLQFGLF